MATIPDPTDRGGGGGEDDDALGPIRGGESGSLVHGGASDNGPLVCAFKGVGDALAGALMGSVFGLGTGLFKKQGFKVALREGGSSAKTFALLSGVHSLVACYLRRVRGVEDALNAGIAGCATGLALSTPGTPQALFQSCVSFGVFSYILENINKPRAALAVPLSSTTTSASSSTSKSRMLRKRNHSVQERRDFLHSLRELALAPVHVLPPFTLPPPAMFAAPFSLSLSTAALRRSLPSRRNSEGPF